MSKVVLFLLLSLVLAVQVISSPVKPHGLEDEVKVHLDELKALVKGTISQAVDELENLYDEMVSFSLTVQEKGIQAIEQEYQSVAAQLVTIHDLASNSGKDISFCTSGREAMIHHLNDEVKERIRTSIEHNNMEGTAFLEKTKYEVDTVINEVGNLEFQLERCGGQILCISPIENEIGKKTVELPQDIKTRVATVTTSIDDIKVMVQDDSDGNVADFTGYVTPLIEQIGSCVNQILGGHDPFPPPIRPPSNRPK